MTLCSTRFDSPVGELTIVVSDRGVRVILWHGADEAVRRRPGAAGAVE